MAWRGMEIRFWGAMHGVGLAVHKACKPVLEKIPDNFITIPIFRAVTFIYVSLLWVFFRAEDFESSVLIIREYFHGFPLESGTSIFRCASCPVHYDGCPRNISLRSSELGR